MNIKKILAQLMALCLVMTSILPNAAFAATVTNTSHKVTLKNSEKGKLAFYPENKEIKDETERSYEPGENAFLSISPEKGYILSDIVIKSDKKEVKADLFTVEEKEDVLGIESIENDCDITATFEKGSLEDGETLASHIVSVYKEKINAPETSSEEKPEEATSEEAFSENATSEEKISETATSEEKVSENATSEEKVDVKSATTEEGSVATTEEKTENKVETTEAEATTSDKETATVEESAENTEEIPEQVATVKEDGEKIPVIDDTTNTSKKEDMTVKEVAKEVVEEKKDIEDFVDGKKTTKYQMYVRHSFLDPAKVNDNTSFDDFKDENQDKLLDALISNQDEIIPLYELKGDSENYYAYPNINGKKDNIKFLDIASGYNNDYAEMIDNYSYDEQTGVYKISKQYFTEENEKKYEGIPIIRTQTLLSYDKGVTSQAGVSVHIKNERNDVVVPNEDQIILSDALDCQIDIPVVTPETANNINISNLAIIVNKSDSPIELNPEKVSLSDKGVLTIVDNIMTLKTIDIIIMNSEWQDVDLSKFDGTTNADNLAAVPGVKFDYTFKKSQQENKYSVSGQRCYVADPGKTGHDRDINNTWAMRNYLWGITDSGEVSANGNKVWSYLYNDTTKTVSHHTLADHHSKKSDYTDHWKQHRFMIKSFSGTSKDGIPWSVLNNNSATTNHSYPLNCTAITTKQNGGKPSGDPKNGVFRDSTIKTKIVFVSEKYVLLGFAISGEGGTKSDEPDHWQAAYGIYKFKYEPIPEDCTLSVNKVIESAHAGNKLLSKAGIKFQAKNSSGKVVETFTTNANGTGIAASTGTAKSKKLDLGTYTVEEVSVPAGTGLVKSAPAQTIKANDSKNYSVTFTNNAEPKPVNMTIRKTITKVDSNTTDVLMSTRYKLSYYEGGHYNRSALNSLTPTSTKEIGVTQIQNSNDYQANINELYYPGTLLIEELPRTDGVSYIDYSLTNSGGKSEGNAILVYIYPDKPAASVNGETKGFIQGDDLVRGNIHFVKQGSDGKRLANAEFDLTNTTTGETHRIKTDANGEYDSAKDNSLWFSKFKNGNGIIQQGNTGDTCKLTVGVYQLHEIRTNAIYGYQLVIPDPNPVSITPSDEHQTKDLGTLIDKEIKIHTTAKDKATNSHFSKQQDIMTINDVVEYENLVAGTKYTMKGVLKDKETGKDVVVGGKPVTAEKTFIPDGKKGTIVNGVATVTFTFNSSALNGHTLVVFEKLFEGNTEIAKHEKIDDTDQTVYIPDIKTTAVDKGTKSKDMSYENSDVKDVVLVDTIAFKNLEPNVKHIAKGVLMDKKTGKEVLDKDGKQITAEKEFTPKEKDGTVEVEFTFSVKGLENADYVVFEKVYRGDELYATHADIEDYGQTVYVPDAHTQAYDGNTKNHSGVIGEQTTIVDRVFYDNLRKGKAYEVSGTLMDKKTGEAFKDAEGKEVTASGWFIAGVDEKANQEDTEGTATLAKQQLGQDESERVSGFVELTFTLDSSLLEGESLVVFEDIKTEKKKVATHADITDEEQTIHYPKIRTTARDPETDEQMLISGDTIKLVDTVTYENLVPGTEYVLVGKLMDKETGEAIKEGAEGEEQEIIGTTTFIPEEANGTQNVEFEFNTSLLEGKRIVVFEKLFTNDVEIGRHEDIQDVDQTIYIPKICTTAVDGETKTDTACNDGEITIIDTVAYTNLLPNVEYTIEGTLMDKTTGQPALDGEGKEITAVSAPFTPEGELGEPVSGTVDVEFTFKTGENFTGFKDGKGASLVAFEKLIHKERVYCVHEDIEDQEQTVYVPYICTTATDSDTLLHLSNADNTVTINDVVTYDNLQKGKKYVMKGVLMDKETNKPLVDSTGKEITSEVEFFAGGEEAPAIDTTQESTETQPTDSTAVDKPEADSSTSTEQNPGTQTDSTATDNTEATTETQTEATTETQPAETIEANKIPRYTGNPAERASGTVTLSFTLNASSLKNKTTVVFESCYDQDRLVAVHNDIEDEAQTVHIPEIRTTATTKKDGKGSHTIPYKKKTITMYDLVEYKNLIPGKEYRLEAKLINKANKKYVTKAEIKFTPKEANGKVNVPLKFNSSKHAGKDLVAFEKLYAVNNEVTDKEKLLIASHEDLNDKGQSVKVEKPKPKKTTNKNDNNPSRNVANVKTGDTLIMYYFLAGAAVMLGVAFILLRKRKTE